MPESPGPIQLEIYRSLFQSVAEEMGAVLRRSAYSPNIKERRDYSCAVFDAGGELMAMGDHMPVHLGSMPLSVQSVIGHLSLGVGDVAILNDPFSGGTHLPDITLVSPVHEGSDGSSKPLFYVACRAHHADVGGMSPGSMPLSRDVFQEGVRIPPLKLYRAGKLNRDLAQLLLSNVRTPVEREGDLAAQVGALQVGQKRLGLLAQQDGRSSLEAACRGLQDYAEKIMRQVIAGIPDGTYTAEDFLDDEAIEPSDSSGGSVRIRVSIRVSDSEMHIDFSGSDPQVRGCLNSVLAIALSSVYYVLRCLAPSAVPSSAGLVRPVRLQAPAGSVVNARFPSATAAGNVETVQRLVDVLLKALSTALPDRIPAASSGTMNNLTVGAIDPGGEGWACYYETIGGGMGASPGSNGDCGIHTHMTNSMNTPIEVLETYYPLRVREYRLRPNSGGRGKFRGGNGIIRTLEALTDSQVTILSERRKHAPYGLQGGKAGKKGQNYLIVRGRRRRLPGKVSLSLGKGDLICIETPGGGGWGAASREARGRQSRQNNAG